MFRKRMISLERAKNPRKNPLDLSYAFGSPQWLPRIVCINFVAFVRNLVLFSKVPLSTFTGHLDWQATSSNRSLVIFIGLADRTERFQEHWGSKLSLPVNHFVYHLSEFMRASVLLPCILVHVLIGQWENVDITRPFYLLWLDLERKWN